MDVEGGTYTITISGYPDDASFDQTTAEVTIASSGQTINRSFSGSWIRTASLMGMVTVEGEGLPGITVAVSGRQDAQMLTDDNGQYTFTGLRAGNYTVEISGFDATDVAFSATSSAVEVAVGESKVWSFEGTYVRESTIAGQVSVEGNGLAGVTISLQGMGADESENTDMGGQFTFSNLRAGEYQLAISGFDTREYGFSTTSATVRVEHGRTANVPFEGIMLRTASIMGQVSIEGEGLADVTVSLSGEGESLTTMTDNSGQYAFSDLPAGNFQVGISGYDTDDYSFETTSKNVALALGETATVPFEGILLRTSGISGRVSVEGMGLDSVTVTLSGDDLEEDMTSMTDASGQYAIAGLAEGDYTVAISDYDDVSYIFETTSMDVTLGDDDTQIVNFMGMHARTASVTVRLFVDEATKNDVMDADEMTFPTPEILAMVAQLGLPLQLPIELIGPGLLDTQPGTPMPDGSVVFANLRAGSYQVVVSDIPDAVLASLPTPLRMALQDYAYGGPATGYPVEVAVGEQAMQSAPVDITHQTVHFSVNLKHGANMGAALPGATVSFFSDVGRTRKIGDAVPGAADGMYSIRFPRSPGVNTAYASVAAPAGSYHTSGDIQAVMWDAKYPMSTASNNEDIVNTMASFSFGGATVMTDMGGGKALGGWKVEVTSGGSAVAGAPGALDADGSASHSEMVAAGDLPKTYEIAIVGWEDQPDDVSRTDDEVTGDGGERFMSTTVMHEHDGLSLAGTSTDAGMMEVTYTTQTLKVYVHHERDQVEGYTGNVLGGDERMDGIVNVDLRYIDDSGRSRGFAPADSVEMDSPETGVTVWSNVPAASDVIVRASLVSDTMNVMLLDNVGGHQDEFAAYQDRDANGIMGGAFGAQGGFHHTVELCPLMSLDDHQRHGECGTFAYVNTYHVFGQVWEWGHAKSDEGFATNRSKMGVPGTTLSLEPVDGENIAGDPEMYTALEEDDRDTRGVDDRLQFDWGRIAEGEYELGVPSGWTAKVGPPEDASGSAKDSVSPLQDDLHIDVTPTTGYVYGVVTDAVSGQPLADVTVSVNGVNATTDSNGRYVARGFSARSYRPEGRTRSLRNQTVVTTAAAGATPTTNYFGFSANSPRRQDIAINMARVTVISGNVTKSGTGEGISNVRIWIDGRPPLNAREYVNPANRFTTIKELRTGSDGSYEAHVEATGGTVEVTVSRSGMFFSPANHTVTAAENASISGINFTGFDNVMVSGRVVDADSAAVSGVKVKATPTSGASARADSTTSSATGSYTLSLPYGQYSIEATRSGYTFAPATQSVNVPGTSAIDPFVVTAVAMDNASLSALSLSGVTLCRTTACPSSARGFRTAVTDYTATVSNSTTMTTVSATASVDGARVDIFPEDADDFESGHQIPLEFGNNTIEVTVTALDGDTEQRYTVTVRRRNPSTTITGTVTDAVTGAGVNRVSIIVSGAYVINANHLVGTARAVRTGSDGTYTAIVESTGATATVIPFSTTRSFTPTGRAVTPTPGSTITSIDFTSAEHGTIMGTVTDSNGGALEDVTVTATNGASVRTAMTTRQGAFTITRVPTGTVTITAEKAGYNFGTQNVFLGPGETRSVGMVAGTGNLMPLNVAAERDTATDGTYDGSATVTWDQGVSGAADAYQPQLLGSDGETWVAFGDLVTTLTAGEGMSTGTTNLAAGSDTLTVTFRVLALTEDPDSPGTYTDTLASATASVGPVNPMVTNVQASRAVDPQPDSLDVTWEARGDNESDWRVVISFDDGTTWHVANATATGGRWMVTLEAASFAGMSDVGSDPATTTDATIAQLEAAFMIRVDYRQRETRGDGTTAVEWTAGPTASVGAK